MDFNNLKTTVCVSSSVTSSVLSDFVRKEELGSMAYQNDVDSSLPGYQDNKYARKQGEWVKIENGTDSIVFYTGISENSDLNYEKDFLPDDTGNIHIKMTDYAPDFNYAYNIPKDKDVYVWWCSNYAISAVSDFIDGSVFPSLTLYVQPNAISIEGKDLYCYRAKFLPLEGEHKYRVTINK